MSCDVVMLLENNRYEDDVRVRAEAETLARAGWSVRVVSPQGPGDTGSSMVAGVAVERFAARWEGRGAAGLMGEYLVAGLQLHARGLRALLRGARVLHLHNPPDLLWPLALLARGMARRVVFDHHDL